MKERMMEIMINDSFINLATATEKNTKAYYSGKIFGYIMACWDFGRITEEEFMFLYNARKVLRSI